MSDGRVVGYTRFDNRNLRWSKFVRPCKNAFLNRSGGMQADLLELLRRIQTAAGASFSGLGLLISEHPERLPLAPLRATDVLPREDLASSLTAISQWGNEAHDGFHVISADFRLVRLSQLLSPPIPPNFQPDAARPFGARFLAARLGSCLPDVLMTGVASRNTGIAIFADGVELFYERPA